MTRPIPRGGKKLADRITFRLRGSENTLIGAAAAVAERNVSAFCREAALSAARGLMGTREPITAIVDLKDPT